MSTSGEDFLDLHREQRHHRSRPESRLDDRHRIRRDTQRRRQPKPQKHLLLEQPSGLVRVRSRFDRAVEVDAGPGLKLDKTEYTATATNGVVTIAYINKDSQRHTLVVVGEDKVIEGNKLVVAGRNAIAVGQFNLKPGKYTIYCDVPGHSASMKATLTVA